MSDQSRPDTLSRRRFFKVAAASSSVALTAAGASTKAVAHGLDSLFEVSYRPAGERKALIIGSGFGGAISALRLTERGVPTLMLEKGRRWPVKPDGNTFSPYIYPDGRSTWLSNLTSVPLGPGLPIDKYVGVLQGVDTGGKRLMNGAAFGGGSIVYGALHVKPKKELFDSVYPAEIRWDDMQPYYDRFAQKVGISATPDDVYNSDPYKHYRVVEEQCQKSGIEVERIQSATDWDVVREELAGRRAPSAIHGEAVYGMNSGGKKSLDTNYLKEAEATGLLEVKTLHEVQSITRGEDGKYVVHANIINEYGWVVDRVSYKAEYLILSAGCYATNSLFVKAKAKGDLPLLNDQVGQGFGNNGNVYALRTVPQETGQWQGGPPSVGLKDYNNPVTPLFIEHPQFPLGIDIHSLMYFGIGITPTRGHFYYDEANDKVKLSWPKDDQGQKVVNEAVVHTMDKLNNDNGGVLNTLLFGGNQVKDDAVYHALGGMVLGQACDFFGRVKGYDKLYAMDGSVLPGTTACANPSFTISAMVERNIERVLAEDF